MGQQYFRVVERQRDVYTNLSITYSVQSILQLPFTHTTSSKLNKKREKRMLELLREQDERTPQESNITQMVSEQAIKYINLVHQVPTATTSLCHSTAIATGIASI